MSQLETMFDQDEEKKERSKWEKRSNVIKEIVTTEFIYVRDVKLIISVFLNEIREKDLIPAIEITNIFANIEMIYGINKELYTELQKRVITFDNEDKAEMGKGEIGNVFLTLADYLKMYTMYVNNHNYSLERHQFCRKKHSGYDKFVTSAEQLDECQNLPLTGFLVKPIQRLCKYPLLFRELLSCTPEDHPDYEPVSQTLQKMNAIAIHIDNMTRSKENLEALSAFVENVIDFPGNMLDHLEKRFLIRSDILQTLDEEHPEMHVYLFTDIMVFTKPMKKREVWEATVALTDIVDSTPEEPSGFRINTTFSPFGNAAYYCNGVGARNLWIKDIISAIETNKINPKGLGALDLFTKKTASQINQKGSKKKSRGLKRKTSKSRKSVNESQDDETTETDQETQILVQGQNVVIQKLERENFILKQKLEELISTTENLEFITSIEQLDQIYNTLNTLLNIK